MKLRTVLLALAAGCFAGDNLGNTPALGLARWTVALPTLSTPTMQENVAFDPSGDVVAIGQFTGTIDFGSGPVASPSPAGYNASFLTKRAGVDGTERWSKVLATSSQSSLLATSVATDSTGAIYVGGYLDGIYDFGGVTLDPSLDGMGFIVKYTADGTLAWAHGLAGDGDVGHVALAPDGTLIVGGGCAHVGGTLTLPGHTIACDAATAPSVGFLARYEADGTFLSDTVLPLGDRKLAVLADESVAVAAVTAVDVVIAGSHILATSAATPVLLHVAVDGTIDSASSYGDPQMEYSPAKLLARSDGTFVAAATTSPSQDDPHRIATLASIGAGGSVEWNAHVQMGPAQVHSAALLPDASVVTGGSIDNYVADFGGGQLIGDAFLASYLADGTMLEARAYGDKAGNTASIWGVASTADGAIAFDGTVAGSVDFGTGPVAGGAGAFVIGLIDPPAP